MSRFPSGAELGAHRSRPTGAAPFPETGLASHGVLGLPLCKGSNKSPSSTDMWNKPPTLVTKRRFLPPFITSQPKRERSNTGGSCAGPLSSLGFSKCLRCHLSAQPRVRQLQHLKCRSYFGNLPHGMHRDVEQEHCVQKYCEALLPDVVQSVNL